MFQLIAEWQNPRDLAIDAVTLLATTGDVLVAVIDLEAFNLSQEQPAQFDILDSPTSETTQFAADWIREVHRATDWLSQYLDLRMRMAPPIVVLGRIAVTQPEIQNLLSVGATYVLKPDNYEDNAPWELRERQLRQQRLLLDLGNLYEAVSNDAADSGRDDDDSELSFDDEDGTIEDIQTSIADEEVNALEIFSNPSLGLTAVDFSRLFALARGYREDVVQPYAEREG